VIPLWAKKLPWFIISEKAKAHGLSPELLAALVQTESGGKKDAVRYEPHWRYLPPDNDIKTYAYIVHSTYDTEKIGHKMSWGPAQVMGTVAREVGFRGWFPSLCSWDLGLEYGCLVLKKKKEAYGDDPERLYAAYNGGSPRMTAGGQYKNMKNVDRFMGFYRDIT
jgi:soluble lytic murein transglycosylase-like protein